jgi:hypothetical protein
MSRSRTPFSSRTRAMLALIANDRSDSVSNSMANASSTGREARAAGAVNLRFEPMPTAHNPVAEALLPTLLDCVNQWLPYFPSLATNGRGANHPSGAGRLRPPVGRILFDRDVSPTLRARQIGRCPSATFKLAHG